MNFDSVLLGISEAVELCAAFVVVFAACRSIVAVVPSRDVDRAKAILGEGVLTALGFSLCATLLKVIGLESWVQIRTFAAVFLLRTLLKQVFRKEQGKVLRRMQPRTAVQPSQGLGH